MNAKVVIYRVGLMALGAMGCRSSRAELLTCEEAMRSGAAAAVARNGEPLDVAGLTATCISSRWTPDERACASRATSTTQVLSCGPSTLASAPGTGALGERLGAAAASASSFDRQSDEAFAESYQKAVDERAEGGDDPADRWALRDGQIKLDDFVGTWRATAGLIFGSLEVRIEADGRFTDAEWDLSMSGEPSCRGSGHIAFDPKSKQLIWDMDFNHACWEGGPVRVVHVSDSKFIIDYDDGEAMAETVVFLRVR